MTKITGGPAFPIPGLYHDESFNGMDLRDHFAGLSMQAYLPRGNTYADTACMAYKMADAMLQERNKP